MLNCWDAWTRLPGQRTRVRRGDAGGTPQTARPCCVVPRGDSRIEPTRADVAQIGPTRSVSAVSACIGRVRPKYIKKKKKKGAKRTVWLNLNTQTPQTLTLRLKLPNTLSHSVPHLPSLCAPSLISLLCVLSSLWVLCAHYIASDISFNLVDYI